MKFRGRGATRTAELEWRAQATQRTLDRWRRKRFSWAEGRTCLHVAWCQLRNLGHRPPSLPRFRSAVAAKRAMQERGWGTVVEMLDAVIGEDKRIAPARLMVGDLAAFEGDAGLDAINICAGPQVFFGWSEGEPGLVVLSVGAEKVKAAWRV